MNTKPWRPLLAATLETEEDYAKIEYPCLASFKVDGMRITCLREGPRTRSNKEIPNRGIRERMSHPLLRHLDGEIVIGEPFGEGVFNRTQSAVMSFDGNPPFSYYVFDSLDLQGIPCPFQVRLDDAKNIVAKYMANRMANGNVHVEVLEHRLIENREQLDAFEAEAVGLGYEGIMVRKRYGKYKNGRSTVNEGILSKVKRFQDAEAVIKGWKPLEINKNEPFKDERGYQKRSSEKAGMLIDTSRVGKLRVEGINGRWKGVEFSVGSGLDDDMRIAMARSFHLFDGKIITYKYQDVGSKDKPRAPIFKGIRGMADVDKENA